MKTNFFDKYEYPETHELSKIEDSYSDEIKVTLSRTKIHKVEENFRKIVAEIHELELRAIKNLYKMLNLSKLNHELIGEFITEEEFFNEVESNEDKYVINLDKLRDEDKVKQMNFILELTKMDVTVDEASEIFSYDLDEFEEFFIKNLNEHNNSKELNS